MAFNEPVIQPLPTDEELRRLVDELIQPGNETRTARALIALLSAVTDLDGNEVCVNASKTSAAHAYSLTPDFEEKYFQFCQRPFMHGQIEKPDSEKEEAGELLH